jgi:cytokinesis protein
MPSSNPGDSKPRQQSTAGRSLFGRKLHKEKSSEGRDDGTLDSSSTGGSASGSRSSRHSKRASIHSLDNEVDSAGLAMTAGVITSIPYHTVSDSKTPIPVDYLPRSDQVPPRKELSPHHMNKANVDFHQYPAWPPTSNSNGASHPTGPRPPPKGPLNTIAPGLQGYVRPGSSATNHTGNYNSYSTTESSNPRTSFDQASINSSISSATRGSSLFSSDNSSRTAVPDHHAHLPVVHQSSSRHSNASHAGWSTQQSSGFASSTSFSPDGFNIPRPADDRVVEEQFISLMHKRGWQNLPDQAKRQMLAYPAAKKWTLVHQDKLTEWQGEQKRRQHARQTGMSDASMRGFGRIDEEGSPEWYVKRVMEDTITAKQLQSLSVSLRTQPIR